MHRKVPSVPLLKAVEKEFIMREHRVLDYGCGRGTDLAWLVKNGYSAEGYDNYYQPKLPTGSFDVVISSYVLNVIPESKMRLEVLKHMKSLCNGRLITTVRSATSVTTQAKKGNWKHHKDGFVTGKGTFQHGFTWDELLAMYFEIGCEMLTGIPISGALNLISI